jgi:hypothetical protein
MTLINIVLVVDSLAIFLLLWSHDNLADAVKELLEREIKKK